MSTRTSAKGKRAPEKAKRLGRITGVNHVVLVSRDMAETVHFYQDILGLKAKATTFGAQQATGLSRDKRPVEIAPGSLYFFDLGNGDTIGFTALPGVDTTANASFFDILWPEGGKTGAFPRGMDHLALNVDTREDLEEVRRRLQEHGIPVSKISHPHGSPFTHSFYTYDPNGVPLEFATFDYGDPAWKERTAADMFRDPDPVPSLKIE